MHPFTWVGILGCAALMAVDRLVYKVPDRLAIAICLVCLVLMLAGFLLKKRIG